MDIFSQKAFLFDFDGVIVDTEKYHYKAWNDACAAFGTRIPEEEYPYLKSTGAPNFFAYFEKKLSRSLTPEEKTALLSAKDASFSEYNSTITARDVLPGVIELIEKAGQRGIVCALASASRTAKERVEALGLEGLFDTITDGAEVARKKPAPDIFLTAAEKCGAAPADCVVFEDSPAGIAAAKNAGIPAVAVGGLKTPDAFVCVDSLEELLP
ncbi:MAG: HAD-IA family hydrolase [Clostridia bacterium]|nr:HAD-IA family hydrolase [Clostridia bacterium]